MKKLNAKKRARVSMKAKRPDLLLQLTEICKGPITLNVNRHRDSYLTTEGALLQMRNKSVGIAPEMEREMVAKDRIIELMFYPVGVEAGYRMFGTDLVDMLQRAIAVTQVDAKVEDIFAAYPAQGINTTATMERLMEIVKCSIIFTIDEHRLINGATAEEFLFHMRTHNPEIESQVGSATWNAMIACNRVVSMSMRPASPAGTYSTMNMQIQPIMTEFLRLAEDENVANTVAVQADAAKDYIGITQA